MENPNTIEVKAYLEYMYKFLEGDLNQIHKICEEIDNRRNMAESYRSNQTNTPIPTPTIQQPNQTQQSNTITAQTTTLETTRAPRSVSITRNFETDEYRLTIPIATTLFSVADLLGALLRNFNDQGDGGFRSTEKNLEHFFKEAYTDNEKELKILNSIYRQGLAHLYFPKLGLALSYHLQKENENLFYIETNDIVLNIRRLEKIVMDKLREVIHTPLIHEAMQLKFNDLNNGYKSSLNSDIDGLRTQL